MTPQQQQAFDLMREALNDLVSLNEKEERWKHDVKSGPYPGRLKPTEMSRIFEEYMLKFPGAWHAARQALAAAKAVCEQDTAYLIEAEWPDRFGVPLEITNVTDLGNGKVGIRVKAHESREAIINGTEQPAGGVHLTAIERQAIIDDLEKDHDGSDFEAECPLCTAYQKLAAIDAQQQQPPVQPIQGLQPVADELTIEQLNSKVERLMAAQPSPDADPNAPWLTEAHMLCTDHGVSQGHITGRIKALREKLEQPSQAGELSDTQLLDYLIFERAYVVNDPDACDGHWLHYARPDGTTWVQATEYETPRAAIIAAINAKEAK